MSIGSHMDFTKEMPSLLSLITFIVLYDLIRLKNYIHWTC